MPFGVEFNPTALRPLIMLIILEIYFSLTGFNSNKFMFEFLRQSKNSFLEPDILLSMFVEFIYNFFAIIYEVFSIFKHFACILLVF